MGPGGGFMPGAAFHGGRGASGSHLVVVVGRGRGTREELQG